MSTQNDDPSGRADAIFEALNVSAADEEAQETAEIEKKVQRMERIREAADAPGSDGAQLTDLGDVAEESPAETVDKEKDLVGDGPDTGGTVPPDQAQ